MYTLKPHPPLTNSHCWILSTAPLRRCRAWELTLVLATAGLGSDSRPEPLGNHELRKSERERRGEERGGEGREWWVVNSYDVYRAEENFHGCKLAFSNIAWAYKVRQPCLLRTVCVFDKQILMRRNFTDHGEIIWMCRFHLRKVSYTIDNISPPRDWKQVMWPAYLQYINTRMRADRARCSCWQLLIHAQCWAPNYSPRRPEYVE